MKKYLLSAAVLLLSSSVFASTDACMNFSGSWVGETAWNTPATTVNYFDKQNGAAVLQATDDNGLQTPQIGYCVNGTIIYANSNSVYVGTIEGDKIAMTGHLIPNDGQVIYSNFTKVP